MTIVYEMRPLMAALIFDLVDRYAAYRKIRGPHPSPIGPINFIVVARLIDGMPQQLAQSLELIINRNGQGYFVFLGKVKLPDGTVRQYLLKEGTYLLRIESRFYQRTERPLLLPDPANVQSFELDPAYTYPFPSGQASPAIRSSTLLRGSVHHVDGQGLAGVKVSVPGALYPYHTDESGQWVLVFPDSQPSGLVVVTFVLPNGVSKEVANVEIVQGRETSLTHTGLRGEVRSNAGVGILDAKISVSGFSESSRTDKSGGWRYYLDLDQPETTVSITAELADGRLQTKESMVRPKSIVWVETFQFA